MLIGSDKWSTLTPDEKADMMTGWRKAFAFWPVTLTNGDIVWLEFYEIFVQYSPASMTESWSEDGPNGRCCEMRRIKKD